MMVIVSGSLFYLSYVHVGVRLVNYFFPVKLFLDGPDNQDAYAINVFLVLYHFLVSS